MLPKRILLWIKCAWLNPMARQWVNSMCVSVTCGVSSIISESVANYRGTKNPPMAGGDLFLPYSPFYTVWVPTAFPALLVFHNVSSQWSSICRSRPLWQSISDSLYISYLYIITHSSRKLQLWSDNEITLWLGSPQYEELYERVAALKRLTTTSLNKPCLNSSRFNLSWLMFYYAIACRSRNY